MGKNTLKLDLSGFERLITDLDKLHGDINGAVDDALSQAGETIGDDTFDAVAYGHLPAKGKYSTGDTKETVVLSPKVEWSGPVASIGVGFDYGKPGAGGYLISGRGTPRMMPVPELQEIYKRKKYLKKIQQDLANVITDYIDDAIKGR